MLRRQLEPAQYTSFDYTQTLADHGVLASVGSVGDAYDNALEYAGWFNHQRLHQSLDDRPPAEFEALYAPTTQPITYTDQFEDTT